MLNTLLKKYVVWSDYRKFRKEGARFMKSSFRREIALAGLNCQNIECSVCKQNKWTFFEKPEHTEIKIACTTCGLLRWFNYEALFARVKALKEKRDAEARNIPPAPETPKAEAAQEPPKEEAAQPSEENKE